MNYLIKHQQLMDISSDCCVIFYKHTNELKNLFKNTSLLADVTSLINSKECQSDTPSSTMYHNFNNKGPKRLMFIGLGTKNDMYDTVRMKSGTLARFFQPFKFKHISVLINLSISKSNPIFCDDFIQGFTLGQYQFKSLKSSKFTPLTINKVTFISNEKNTTLSIDDSIIKAQAQNTARDLANLPGNLLTPELFINQAKTLLSDSTIKQTIYNTDDIQKKGMNALYSVGKGSNNPPFLLKLEHNTASKKPPIILVGKGITFDSGGLSIKPSKGMSEMKADMSGAAAVFSTLLACSKLSLPHPVIGLIPLAENMPSGTAYRPGDVITAFNGTSIEITNTDAEGRLILADALSYAATLKPKFIVDVATLTGAACVALGDQAAAIFGNYQPLIQSFLSLEEHTGERFWQLPLFSEYKEHLKSYSADCINASENRFSGGAITAAKFLEQFVDKHHWMHLDIAPMMRSSKPKGYMTKGMSGFSTRTLIELISKQST